MLAKIKVLLGLTDTSQDALLKQLIEIATDDIQAMCHRENVAGILNSVIIQAVVYNYNLLGTEGLNSESYSGTSFTYSTDYPEALMKKIRAFRKPIIV